MATKLFDLITEADARTIEPGSTIHLAPRGVVTPLAARHPSRAPGDGGCRRWRAERPGSRAGGGYPAGRDYAADHSGVALKAALVSWLQGRGLAVADLGVADATPADYPDTAAAVALAVVRAEADAGIVIDGAGLGSAIAANKIDGIRAAMCVNETLARYARQHNGANVLALGATLLTVDEAKPIVARFLETPMTEPRYIARLAKITRLESA
jgi:ribose 5-phosphate isomerase B